MANSFEFKGNKLTFEFDNEEAANHFKTWLCGQGEQDYWTWMKYREEEEEGNITGRDFDYWSGTEVIKVKCGRMDKDD
jgi:hypothetical protein